MPEIGDKAPDFTLPSTSGGDISLSDLKGAPIVLFFYPRDDTPGCTKESIGFSESLQDFTDAGPRCLAFPETPWRNIRNSRINMGLLYRFYLMKTVT